MKSQTSIVATNVRLQEWAMQIKACRHRPEGMKVDTWCELNDITPASYYYRLRRVRQACLDMTGTEQPAEFIEVPAEQQPEAMVDNNASSEVAATITLLNGLHIELLNSAKPAFIQSLIGVVSHAE